MAVVCTDTDAANVDVSQIAAQHLIDVGASAILGPGSSGLVLNVAKNVSIPKGEFLIAPSATTTQLTGLSPLVWRTAPSDEIQSRALSASVTELEAKYRADNMIMMATPIQARDRLEERFVRERLFSSSPATRSNGLPSPTTRT